jgi:pimeloyl-ACP methyl ester carboxylesterase
VTEDDLSEASRTMANLQQELATLSTNSIHHVIPDAGHYIHWDDPAAVTRAITDAIDLSRTELR